MCQGPGALSPAQAKAAKYGKQVSIFRFLLNPIYHGSNFCSWGATVLQSFNPGTVVSTVVNVFMIARRVQARLEINSAGQWSSRSRTKEP